MRRFLCRSTLFSLALSLFFSSIPGCRSAQDESRKVVVRLGENTITLGEYRDALKRILPPGHSKNTEDLSELKKELINQLIEEELILREAARSGITVTDQELSSEVEGLKKEYGDEAFKSAIAERYGSLDNWKEEIRRKLIVRKAMDKVVSSRPAPTEEEAKRYYREHLHDYDIPEQVHARMIVVASEEDARKIRAKLKPSKFAEVAKARSLSPEGKNGGDLGFFSRGEMPLEFEEVVFKLKPGEISPVIKTEYGYHIFYLEEKRKGGRLGFKEVRDRIMEKLRLENADQEVSNWISSLKKSEKIEVNERLL